MSGKRLTTGLVIVTALAVVPFVTAQNITRDQPTRWLVEPAPVFRVQEVLSGEIIQGPDYFITQDVPVRDYKYLFTIRIENVQHLVYRATTAYNEAEGLGVIREIQLLRSLHEQHGIDRIDIQGLPVAMLADGRVVIVNSADYINDTQELHDAIAVFRRARPIDHTIFVTAGRVSSRTRQTLSDYAVQVSESGQVTLVAPTSRR